MLLFANTTSIGLSFQVLDQASDLSAASFRLTQCVNKLILGQVIAIQCNIELRAKFAGRTPGASQEIDEELLVCGFRSPRRYWT